MNLLPMFISWAALASSVLALAFYRRVVANKEDDYVHVSTAVSTDVSAQQIAVANKLQTIDRWGKILTVVAAVFGLALLGVFLYNGWTNPPRAY